ncbi:hydrogen peroxide-inducible genes activator [Corynebacterium caspium]|uniref:hydrogen peroxide-inducible genes activator n=1 Tax=Corynebacterium caspium TaxID=234828 RepID=UPI00037E0828|nr:hydrogen peroxide-inducible genes activator [Corynebacterium caspium]WKD59134.1 putative hydrogen peroxide-inducible genes activator [Corynebacterium caspium DSM 44850]
MSTKEYRPTLAQLRTFVTIAENKHFGTAAQKLNISQPSLSQALVALETGLGAQLIERSTRKVIVTPTGASLLPYAKATLDAAEAFLNHSQGADGDLKGQLTIGIIPTIAPYVLPELLQLIQHDFPELVPRIVEDRTAHLLSLLRDGQIDFAVMALPSEYSGMIDVQLYEEPFYMVLPKGHMLNNQQNVTLEALGDIELLLLDEGHCLHDQIMDLCRRANLNPGNAANAVTRASSLTTIVQLVSGGYGATLVPASAVNVECRRPDLGIASFADSMHAKRRVGLVFRSSSARAKEFNVFGELLRRAYNNSIKSALLHYPLLKNSVS